MEKKTFIFNLEWYEVLKEYPSEVRFEVYEAVMEYVSSGILPDLKPIAKMAFSFIKKELDYNFARYEAIVGSRSVAGKKGSEAKRKRAKQANAEFAETDQAKQANAEFAETDQAKQANAEFAETDQAKQANASYNVNVNVNDNVFVVDEMTREDFFDYFFSPERKAIVEQYCMARNFGSVENFKALARRVLAEWGDIDVHPTIKDACLHLVNHCDRKQTAERRQQEDEKARRSAANRQTDKAPRRVNDQWEGFEVPTE